MLNYPNKLKFHLDSISFLVFFLSVFLTILPSAVNCFRYTAGVRPEVDDRR